MVVEEVRPRSLGPTGARWLAYGAAGVATAAAFMAAFARTGLIADVLTILSVTAAVLVVVGIVAAPEAFEHSYPRYKGRMINLALIIPATALLMVSLNTPLAHPEAAWLVAAGGAALALLAGIWAPTRPALQSPQVMLGFLVFYGAMAGFGGALMIDTRLDHAPGAPFQAPVVKREISFGRYGDATYYVRVGPGGPLAAVTLMAVPSDTYQALREGGPACITQHPGTIGLAWYSVAAC
jgi:hypothetical protein